MKKIQVYECENTGKVFKTLKGYNNHIRKTELKNNEEERRKRSILNRKETMNRPRLESESIEEFNKLFIDAINESFGTKDLYIVDIVISIGGFGNISNTHSCPIGGTQNFTNDSGKPTSYLGWNGNIRVVYNKSYSSFDEKLYRNLNGYGINTGSGGYRGNEYEGKPAYILEYCLILFLDDFPKIKEQYNKFLEYKEGYEKYIESTQAQIDKDIIDNKFINGREELINSLLEKIRRIETRASEERKAIYDSKNKILSNYSEDNYNNINELRDLNSIFSYYLPQLKIGCSTKQK